MGTTNRMGMMLAAAAVALGGLAGVDPLGSIGNDDRRYTVQTRRHGGKPTSTPSKAKARELRQKKATLAKKSRAKNRGR